jgi:hypothetical protein
LVIQPRYDEASCFREGRARVVLRGRVGYIDLNGKLIGWLPDVEDSWRFSSGLALFNAVDRLGSKLPNAVGYQDRSGQTVVLPQYSSAKEFSEGLAAVKQSSGMEWWGYIDPTGRMVIPFQFHEVRSFHEGLAPVTVREQGVHGLSKQGVIDRNGRLVVTAQAWFIEDDFSEGLVAVETGEEWPRRTSWGYINSSGTWVIPPRFRWALRFSEGLAPVAFPEAEASPNGFMGYIDKRGQTVIPPAFTSACPFENGLAMVQIRRQVGFVDRKGNFVWGPMEEPAYKEDSHGEDVPWPCPGITYLSGP